MEKGADKMIADLKALRNAPLADPYIGPAILEGRAAGVFFHEIFGHRVEGHRQKNEDEGQTFAKKVGEPVMPDFVVGLRRSDAVADRRRRSQRLLPLRRRGRCPRSARRWSTRACSTASCSAARRRAASRSRTATAAGRRGVPSSRARATWWCDVGDHPRRRAAPRLLDEAKRQGKPYGLLFGDISGGFTNTTRTGPQAFKVLPILVYRVYADGRPDELVRGVDLVGTPLASLSRILATGDDYQTFNGFCGAESGWVPVSATSPSLLVQQIEIERRDKGSDKPPVLPAPSLQARMPAAGWGR